MAKLSGNKILSSEQECQNLSKKTINAEDDLGEIWEQLTEQEQLEILSHLKAIPFE